METRTTPSKATVSTYRGYTISHERFGHVNVWTEEGFVGGFPTMAAAHRKVDSIVNPPTVVKVGPNAYRVVTAC